MNPRERLKTAMQRRQPDRVPVWCPLSLEHIIRNGTPDGLIPRSIEDFVQAECRLTLRYGFDGAVLYLPAVRQGTPIGDHLKKWLSATPTGDSDHVFEQADPEQWESVLPVYEQEDFYSSLLAREILGQDYHLGGWTPDGFSKAIQWFPQLEDALIATRMDSQRFQALVEHFDRESIAYARAQIRLGALESMHISSPYAGASFLSRETYETLVLPSVRALAAAVREEGAFSYLHTCGFLADRLELAVSSGVDGLECLDPPPLGNVELAQAKKQVGNQVFLKGNIDSVNVLLLGSEEKVEAVIRHCLDAGMPGGGYILSTACSVAPAVPPERVQKLAQMAETYTY